MKESQDDILKNNQTIYSSYLYLKQIKTCFKTCKNMLAATDMTYSIWLFESVSVVDISRASLKCFMFEFDKWNLLGNQNYKLSKTVSF